METARYATYYTRVYPINRNSDYSSPVVVIATSRRGAIDRAIDLGWSGRATDARVIVDRVEDIFPTEES